MAHTAGGSIKVRCCCLSMLSALPPTKDSCGQGACRTAGERRGGSSHFYARVCGGEGVSLDTWAKATQHTLCLALLPCCPGSTVILLCIPPTDVLLIWGGGKTHAFACRHDMHAVNAAVLKHTGQGHTEQGHTGLLLGAGGARILCDLLSLAGCAVRRARALVQPLARLLYSCRAEVMPYVPPLGDCVGGCAALAPACCAIALGW